MLRRLFALFPSSHYVLLSALFFVGLELIVAFHQWLLAVTVALLAILIYGIFLVRLEEAERFRAVQIILPFLAAVGLTGLAFFLPRTELLHVYFAVAGIVFYGLLRHGARLAYPTWNWIIALLVFFLNVAIILGVRFHLYVPLTATLAALFGLTFLLSYQSLARVASSGHYAVLLACGLSLCITEIAWTLQFLPLFFLVQAGILVAVYYVFFYCLILSIEGRLTRRQIGEYIVVGTVALTVLLLSARWL